MNPDDYLRVGQFVKGVNLDYWHNPQQVLRVAKRKKYGSYWPSYRYFVVGLGHPVGYGVWVTAQQVRPLSGLEALALQLEV